MISPIEFAELKKMLMVGLNESAESLALYIGQTVEVSTEEILVLSLEDVAKTLGNKEEVVTAVLLRVTGDIEGELLYIFDAEEERNSLHLLTSKHGISADRSALQEFANIASAHGFTAIDAYFGMETAYSAPGVAHDMFGSVTDPVIASLGTLSEKVFLVRTEFQTHGTSLFKTIFLASATSTRKMMDKVKHTDHDQNH